MRMNYKNNLNPIKVKFQKQNNCNRNLNKKIIIHLIKKILKKIIK